MFVLVLASLSSSLIDGYHSFKVTKKRPFFVTLRDKMLIFALDELPHPEVTFTAMDSKNSTSPIPMASFTHVQFFQTSVYVSITKGRPYVLHYWLLPPTICPSVSYSAMADRSITFKLEQDKLTSDFCLFSQSGASSYSVKFEYESQSLHTRVEFWSSAKRPDRKCKGEVCQWKSSKPFFMRVINGSDAAFTGVMALSIFRSGIQSTECSLKVIPIVVESNVQIPMGHFSVTDIKCVAMAEYLLVVVGVSIAAAITAIAILMLFHTIGFIDLRACFGCRSEEDHFKGLKENPYAHQIE
jgi:hypothetical protein